MLFYALSVSRVNRFAETNEMHEIKKQIEEPKYMNADTLSLFDG
jgi:hypothetical protein